MTKRKMTKKSKRRLMIFGIPSIIVIAYFIITFSSYIYNYSVLKKQEKELNNELYNLQEEKAYLKTEILKLHDPSYIIRYAKEKFLYSTDGEYVIKLEEDKIEEETEVQESYIIYIVLGVSAVVLSILFLKNKKEKWKLFFL